MAQWKARVAALAGAVAALTLSLPALAQQTTLRIHHFLPAQAPVPSQFIEPWAKRVEQESGGRLKFELYPSMQLGGRPNNLYDQAKDGVVDIVWTLLGYTPGRFPKAEAFELPFLPSSGEATSQAAHEFFEKHLKDEFKDVHVIMVHVHGPGLLHIKGNPVTKLEDMRGRKLRGPSRVVNEMLEKLGATPVGMPVPQVTEALSRGVIDGTVVPWEVTRSLRVPELVNSHTNFSGDRGLYTAMFVFAMNKAKYESLPADLKAVLDRNSGLKTAAEAGRVMDAGDKPAFDEATKRGNKIIVLDEAETNRWKQAAQPAIDEWLKEMTAKGVDAKSLYEDARALVAKYTKGGT